MLVTLVSAAAAFYAPLRPLGAGAVAHPAFVHTARPTMAVAWPTPLHTHYMGPPSRVYAQLLLFLASDNSSYFILGSVS